MSSTENHPFTVEQLSAPSTSADFEENGACLHSLWESEFKVGDGVESSGVPAELDITVFQSTKDISTSALLQQNKNQFNEDRRKDSFSSFDTLSVGDCADSIMDCFFDVSESRPGSTQTAFTDLEVYGESHRPVVEASPSNEMTTPKTTVHANGDTSKIASPGNTPLSKYVDFSLMPQEEIEKEDRPIYGHTYDSILLGDSSKLKTVSVNTRRGRNIKTFPMKLHCALSSTDPILNVRKGIWWFDHGRSFVIKDQDWLTNIVLPHFSKKVKYTSFSRQLQLWGFKRLKDQSYYHPCFLRGMPKLATRIALISRNITTGTADLDFVELARFRPLPHVHQDTVIPVRELVDPIQNRYVYHRNYTHNRSTDDHFRVKLHQGSDKRRPSGGYFSNHNQLFFGELGRRPREVENFSNDHRLQKEIYPSFIDTKDRNHMLMRGEMFDAPPYAQLGGDQPFESMTSDQLPNHESYRQFSRYVANSRLNVKVEDKSFMEGNTTRRSFRGPIENDGRQHSRMGRRHSMFSGGLDRAEKVNDWAMRHMQHEYEHYQLFNGNPSQQYEGNWHYDSNDPFMPFEVNESKIVDHRVGFQEDMGMKRRKSC